MTAINPKQKLIAVGLAFVIVLFVFVGVLYRPQVSKLRELREQRTKESTELGQEKSTAAKLEETKRELEKVQGRLKEFSSKIPATEDFPVLLREVQRLANEAGVNFMALKASPLEGQNDYAVLPLEIRIDGFYKNVVDFLWRLHNLTREIKVTSMEINEGEGGLPHIEVAIHGSSFVLKKVKAEVQETATSGEQTEQ